MDTICHRIATELSVASSRVEAAVRLLDDGATVPFIARYRKEATYSLTDTELRVIEERLGYLRELDARRAVVLHSITEQEKLTPELEQAINAAATKTQLEDLYLPYKPKRRSRGSVAREAGLEPLAFNLLNDPTRAPDEEAAAYADPDKGVADVAAALDGARWILMETFAEDPELVGRLREYVWENGRLQSRVVPGKEQSGAKFSDYFAAIEPMVRIPSHRALALFRGRKEGILRLNVALDEPGAEVHAPSPAADDNGDATTEPGPRTETAPRTPSFGELCIADRYGIRDEGRPADLWLLETVRLAWKVKILPRMQAEAEHRLREQAEAEAIKVFGRNLRDLLLAAPAGGRRTMGLDPGLRTGVKVAVVDETGQLQETATIYPHQPRNEWEQAIETLAELVRKHDVELISIGNGTASRETDRLVAQLIRQHPGLGVNKIVVSEAGASVYSASKLAARELSGLDVTLRGAVSIARRLQDPLAELVKIEPKAIGVGQYQHDVNQAHLARTLEAVVEDGVNMVGADLNTASVSLLARVSGLNHRLAENIVAFRNQQGPFRNRRDLQLVPRLGEKTFELAAGFLRIVDGENLLDASAVHPEAYPVVERISEKTGREPAALIGDNTLLRDLSPEDFVDDRFGVPTVRDILLELEKPGRDPRPEFKMPTFMEGVEELSDLQPDMVLEGVVTNVANFGAFVDIGVHQDGLVHVSQLANRFVKDPRDVVKAGDIVKVRVLEVDLQRKRISLSMRLPDVKPAAVTEPPPRRQRQPAPPAARPQPLPKVSKAPVVGTAMAAAFAKLRRED
jgi:protein Tex